MSFLKRISNAFAWNHLNKITGYLLDFFLSIVLARGLGDYYYGIYSELFNFIFLFSLICSFGIDTAINVYLPKYSGQKGIISFYLRRTLLLIAGISLIMVILTIFLSQPLSQLINSPEIVHLLKIAALYIVFHNFLILAQTILICYYETQFLFIANTFLKIFFIIFAWILLKFEFGIQEIIWAFIGISLIVSVGYLFKFIKYLKPRPEKTKFSAYIQFGLVAWFTKFINYLLGRYFDIFLLGYFAVSKEEIGYYNIAFSITLALLYLFTSGFSGISIAAFSEFEKNQEYEKIKKGIIAVIKICNFFSVPVFLYVILNAHMLIKLLYSSTYQGSSVLLQVFASFFLITIVLGSGINSSVLYSLKKEKTVLTLRIIMGLVNVILDFILIPEYKAMGAIVATGISTVGIIGFEHFFVRKNINIKYPVLFLIKVLVAASPALLISIFIPTKNLIWLVINFAAFGLIYLGFNLLTHPLSREDKERIGSVNPKLARLVSYF